MFPSDLFPQLVNFAEELFLVPCQGFGYVYFAFGTDTKIGEITSFLVNKLPSVRIEAIPHIPSGELDYYLSWCIFFKSWQWVRGQYILLLHLYADSSPNRHYKLITRVTLTRLASHAGVFRGARISSLPRFVGREAIRAPVKAPAWVAITRRDARNFKAVSP